MSLSFAVGAANKSDSKKNRKDYYCYRCCLLSELKIVSSISPAILRSNGEADTSKTAVWAVFQEILLKDLDSGRGMY
uniref:Uncharacterized protein n=1 Tax=Romanomermis culicivorax TaxID=13658 RepID=A0A915IAD1_ROMCU